MTILDGNNFKFCSWEQTIQSMRREFCDEDREVDCECFEGETVGVRKQDHETGEWALSTTWENEVECVWGHSEIFLHAVHCGASDSGCSSPSEELVHQLVDITYC